MVQILRCTNWERTAIVSAQLCSCRLMASCPISQIYPVCFSTCRRTAILIESARRSQNSLASHQFALGSKLSDNSSDRLALVINSSSSCAFCELGNNITNLRLRVCAFLFVVSRCAALSFFKQRIFSNLRCAYSQSTSIFKVRFLEISRPGFKFRYFLLEICFATSQTLTLSVVAPEAHGFTRKSSTDAISRLKLDFCNWLP